MKESFNYDFVLKTPLSRQWEEIGLSRRSGVIVPLFSIRSRESGGIGEYPDLKFVIDWCKLTGNSIVQLLPLNDTGFLPSPFSPLTSVGLNPIHISLSKISQKENERIKKLFVQQKRIDYRVGSEKLKSLKKIFPKQKLNEEFYHFIKENEGWLNDYSLFKALKEFHQNKSWTEWKKEFQDKNSKEVFLFKDRHQKKILFWQWVQWVAFNQMREVKEYAERQNVLLKGDLPHFISKDSADCWAEKDWFRLDQTAGAPPDEFSEIGQDWGLPPYDWQAIEKDNFDFIKRRLSYAENFYHLFRIDHVIGLFRTWLVKESSFDLKSNYQKRGEKILRAMIDASSMLPCAEDMGTIPNFCRQTIGKLGIPGLDITRGQRRYRKLAVSTLSTHDMDLFPDWAGPGEIKKATKKAIQAPSIFAIFLIFDWLFFSNDLDPDKAADYRINRPGINHPDNWSIVIPYPVEEFPNLPGNREILDINQLRILATPLI